MSTIKRLVASHPRNVPQLWAQVFGRAGWTVDADDLATLIRGPGYLDQTEIYASYLEAWDRVLRSAVLKEDGRHWRLYQDQDNPDGDLVAVLCADWEGCYD